MGALIMRKAVKKKTAVGEQIRTDFVGVLKRSQSAFRSSDHAQTHSQNAYQMLVFTLHVEGKP
jgi:hypothetical protein